MICSSYWHLQDPSNSNDRAGKSYLVSVIALAGVLEAGGTSSTADLGQCCVGMVPKLLTSSFLS